MLLLRLVANQVKVGVPLPFGVRNEQGALLLGAGQIVNSDTQLETLLERGLYADLEEIKALKARLAQEAAARRAHESPAVATRRATIFDLWEQALWRLQRLYESAIQTNDFAQQCSEFAAQLITLVRRDPDVGIYLSMRQDERRLNLYGITHSLHTALVCQLMATRLGWPEERILTLVQAALTMNISIYELQGRLAALGRPTESQRVQIHTHPAQSVLLLQAAGVSDPDWLQAVALHHERPDGSGYPQGIKNVDELALSLELADIFMAKISPRAQRAPLPIQDAARQMYTESHGSPAAAAIIKEYGIYPPGDFVQLASGEQAVVIRRGATAHTPVAAAITDRRGLPVISTVRRDTSHSTYAIVGPAADKRLVVRVPPERLFGLLE
ncbi:MAG: HD-GYP domain-containing protein [Leptothrix sp. (in: b-proteobacteria)]